MRSLDYTLNIFLCLDKPSLKMSPSTSVIEGEALTLNCTDTYDKSVKIIWIFGNKTYDSKTAPTDRVQYHELGGYGARLVVSDITMEDKGDAVCKAWYPHNEEAYQISSVTTEIKVKDKLAALWPFLGICAEVVVLCTIILIYEKKRNKAELEESDTDQSPDT